MIPDRHTRLREPGLQLAGVGRRHRNQQAPRGLRIEEQVREVRRQRPRRTRRRLPKCSRLVAIPPDLFCDDQCRGRPSNDRHRARESISIVTWLPAAISRRVAEQAEAGDVGAGMNAVQRRRSASAAALFSVRIDATARSTRSRRGAAELDRRADDAGAERLGQDQARRPACAPALVRMRVGSTAPVTA